MPAQARNSDHDGFIHHIVFCLYADWGITDPLAVPKTAALMKRKESFAHFAQTQ
jgi:hypothetical protein